MAYVSEESGRPEVFIRASMAAGPPREVVSPGASQPVWTRDGRELLFVDPEGMFWAVPVRRAANGRPVVGSPAACVAVPPLGAVHYNTHYHISPDGHRVFFLDRQPRDPPRDISIILGWRKLIN